LAEEIEPPARRQTAFGGGDRRHAVIVCRGAVHIRL
jgi:hypothetical protein